MDRKDDIDSKTGSGRRKPLSGTDQAWRSLSHASLGIEMAVATLIGWGFGYWLDGKFGTDPIFMLLFLVLGVAAGFKGLIRAAKQARRDLKDSP